MRKKLFTTSGLTMIELIVSMTIFVMVITVISNTYINFTASKRKLLLTNELHNETAFLLERIAREIQNGTIDYQAYWKENIFNLSARHWAHESGEGPNPIGADINDGSFGITDITTNGLNSYINCNDPDITTDSSSDTDSLEERKNIIFNYRYQFIYPGDTAAGGGNDQTNGQVHLNCVDDNINSVTQYNVYDDELAYGAGPRAFGEEGNGALSSYTAADLEKNSAQASEMLWDWDLTSIDPVTDNYPPLMLVKENSDGSEFTRTAMRYENNKIKLIRFKGVDTDTNPPDFIPDEWICDSNFECDGSYDGSYIWSEEESSTTSIGSITDSNLEWADITPEKIQITNFDFILSPVKDPQRAFFEKDRIQKPQVTIIIEAKAKEAFMKGVKGEAPSIELQTTITPRVWDIIEIDN